MKKLLLALLFLPTIALGYTSPGQPSGFVNDFAGILSPKTEENIEANLTALEMSQGSEVTVVTIPTTGSDETIETYAVKLFEEWGIGKEEEDNGLLLLIARDDRVMRIEVGYGLEPIITDIESGYIIREILTPAFKIGQYDAGVEAAIRRIDGDIRTGSPMPEENMSAEPHWVLRLFSQLGNLVYFLFYLLILWGARFFAKTKSWWLGGVIGGVVGWLLFSDWMVAVLLIVIGLIFDYIASNHYREGKGDHHWWLGGPGGGPGGGKGGGFGGFGGGMSGGGGASGRW